MSSDSPIRPSRILVIDDEPSQVQLLEAMLKPEGYQIHGFNDSQTALEKVADLQPDLILTDLIMPRMDGFELLRQVKNDEATRSIPVMLVTAKHDQQTESEGLRLGAADFIAKPFAALVVKARVRTQLELKQHRDQLENLVQLRTAELSRSRQQFKDLVDKSLVGIAIFIDRQIAYQNPELKRIICNLDRHTLNHDFSFLHPDDRPKIQKAYYALETERLARVETDFRIIKPAQGSATPETSWVNCRAVRFTYRAHNAILVNIVDITRTKEMERLLMIRNKMVSLGRIASGMAHEIRNPLSGINAYLYSLQQLCEQDTLSPEEMTLMAQIVSQLKIASGKVDSVIKRVLDFAKPTAPRMVPIDLNQSIDNVLKLTAVILHKEGLEIKTAFCPDLPKCHADATLIEQVILNLVQNAIRAVKQHQQKKRIEIRTYYSLDYVSMDLSDSGPGVPADLREKIFDPFFTTHSDGSGIGLSIAQRIVTDHNGVIAVSESELGGARFTITIPIEKRIMNR